MWYSRQDRIALKKSFISLEAVVFVREKEIEPLKWIKNLPSNSQQTIQIMMEKIVGEENIAERFSDCLVLMNSQF